MSIDPAGSYKDNLDKNAEDPQRWNLYLYCRNNPLIYIDPDGESYLFFNRTEQRLYLYSREGTLIGSWNASNNVSADAEPWPDGTYTFFGFSPHSNANPSNSISNSGIYIFEVPGRRGLGVHAGRNNNWQHPTKGCIRTNEESMSQIRATHANDPLTHIRVETSNPQQQRQKKQKQQKQNLAKDQGEKPQRSTT